MTRRPGHELFGLVGHTRRWVAVDSTLGIITIGSGIGLIALATSLLTRSALLGATVSLSLTILGVRFFAVSRVVGRYCERYLGHLGTFKVLTRLRVWLFARLIDDDTFASIDQRRGDIVTGLVDDIETMQDRLLRVSSPPIIALGALAIGVAALVAIDVRAAVILGGTFLIAASVMPPLVHARTRGPASRLVELRAQRLSEATELLDGLETLTVWGRTDLLGDALAPFDVRESEIVRHLTVSRALLDAVVTALTGGCVIAVVAVLGRSGEPIADVWWVAAAPLITLATFEALGPLLARPEHKARTDRAAARILGLAGRGTSSTTPRPTASPVTPAGSDIELERVSFAHPDGASVLADASLSIPSGTTVAISAPSGTGKSTLVGLLVGLVSPSSGTITIGGTPTTQLGEIARPLIVAVMQFDHVFDTSIRDNLLVGNGDATDAELLEACTIAGLTPFLDDRGGLDSPIGPNGALLSGGERQRLIIARALVADAPVLVLDEATEHLEPDLRTAVMAEVLNARRGRTTIVLGHRVEPTDHFDIVLDLADGTFRARR